MSDFTVRTARAEDLPALKEIWKASFDDSEDYINRFQKMFFEPRHCYLAEADGRAVSALYLLDGPVLHGGRKLKLKGLYVFAFATLPAYRGRGIGSAVYKACCESVLSDSADIVCVHPAEPSLFPYYEGLAPCATIAACREYTLSREELQIPFHPACMRIGAEQYAVMRNSMLENLPHAEMNESFLDLQELHAELFDGDFFVMSGGIACTQQEGDTCHIKELLIPGGDELDAIAALAAFCPAQKYTARAPLFFDGPGQTRRLVLGTLREGLKAPGEETWWGPVFD